MQRPWMGFYIGACSQKVRVHMQSGSGTFNMTMQGAVFESVMSFWGSAGRGGAWEQTRVKASS